VSLVRSSTRAWPARSNKGGAPSGAGNDVDRGPVRRSPVASTIHSPPGTRTARSRAPSVTTRNPASRSKSTTAKGSAHASSSSPMNTPSGCMSGVPSPPTLAFARPGVRLGSCGTPVRRVRSAGRSGTRPALRHITAPCMHRSTC
jgi:hypothetical protein